jgi:cell division septation protein DedD
VPVVQDSESSVAPDSDESASAPAVTRQAPASDTVPGRFCLAVGTYLFSDRARLMAHQLSKRTRLDAWVDSVGGDGARNYRILVGDFRSESEAEKVADRLLGRGLVSEAMVEPLPAKHGDR